MKSDSKNLTDLEQIKDRELRESLARLQKRIGSDLATDAKQSAQAIRYEIAKVRTYLSAETIDYIL